LIPNNRTKLCPEQKFIKTNKKTIKPTKHKKKKYKTNKHTQKKDKTAKKRNKKTIKQKNKNQTYTVPKKRWPSLNKF